MRPRLALLLTLLYAAGVTSRRHHPTNGERFAQGLPPNPPSSIVVHKVPGERSEVLIPAIESVVKDSIGGMKSKKRRDELGTGFLSFQSTGFLSFQGMATNILLTYDSSSGVTAERRNQARTSKHKGPKKPRRPRPAKPPSQCAFLEE